MPMLLNTSPAAIHVERLAGHAVSQAAAQEQADVAMSAGRCAAADLLHDDGVKLLLGCQRLLGLDLNGPGRDGIDVNVVFPHFAGEGPSESDDGALRRDVVGQVGRTRRKVTDECSRCT